MPYSYRFPNAMNGEMSQTTGFWIIAVVLTVVLAYLLIRAKNRSSETENQEEEQHRY